MILAFAGSPGSGKSSVSSAVAALLEWSHTSFGGYVRAVAVGQRVPQTREGLQSLGAELLKTLGPVGLTEQTLRQVGWTPGANVVLDGVRHERVLEAIRALGPTIFVYIDVERTTREERLQRDGRLASGLAAVEAHSTEVEVEHLLRPQADEIIDGTRNLNEIAAELAARVEDAH